MDAHSVTERGACRALSVNRTAYRYEAIRLSDEDEVRADIIDKACNYGRVGYRMVTAMMRNEGWEIKPQARGAHMAGRGAEAAPKAGEKAQVMAK